MHKDLKRGSLAWVRHPSMELYNRMVPGKLVRILGVNLVSTTDTEYFWVDMDGDTGHCYSAWLAPISPVEAIVMELYGKVPPSPRDDG